MSLKPSVVVVAAVTLVVMVVVVLVLIMVVIMAAVPLMIVVVVVLVLIMVVIMAAAVVFVIMVMVVMVGTQFSVVIDHLGELVAVAASVLVLIVVVIIVTIIFVVVVMVVVLQRGFVDVVVESGVVDGVNHPVGELVLVDVQDGAHEVEFDKVAAGEGAVVLDTVVHVDEVEGEAGTVLDEYCAFDVPEEASRLPLNVLSDVHEDIRHPCLRIGVPVLDGAGEAGGDATGLVERGPFVIVAHAISSNTLSRLVFSFTDTGMTSLSGKRDFSHAVAFSISPGLARSALLIMMNSEPCICLVKKSSFLVTRSLKRWMSAMPMIMQRSSSMQACLTISFTLWGRARPVGSMMMTSGSMSFLMFLSAFRRVPARVQQMHPEGSSIES